MKSEEGTIRLAKIEDAKRITDLFNSNKFVLGDNKIKYFESEIKEYIKKKIDRVIVFEKDNKIIGVFLAQFWSDYIYIHTAIIDRKYIQHGIGTKLLEYLEKHGKKEKKDLIEVEVETDNKIMNQFLQKRKFKRGKKFFYYSKELK